MNLRSTRHPFPEENRAKLVDLLNVRLAALGDLRSQVKQAHWNVRGPQFIALHELFDQLVGDLTGQIDEVAERATALGGLALGTVRLSAKHSILDELPVDATDGLELVTHLSDRYAQVSALLTKGINAAEDLGDEVTVDLFIEVNASIDKNLWFLEAHLGS